MQPLPLIIVTGPTACGKTRLAADLARSLGAEIISADSRQVFKRMDLGTGKDLADLQGIPLHLVDILEPGEEFSVSQFVTLARQALDQISSRGKIPLLCGGTGHYIKALVQSYSFDQPGTDLASTNQREQASWDELEVQARQAGLWEERDWKKDSKRRLVRALEKLQLPVQPGSVPLAPLEQVYQVRILVLQRGVEQTRHAIAQRLQERLDQGMILEVQSLLDEGVSPQRLERYGLEYKWILYYILGRMGLEEMQQKLYTEICRFAKRQRTFLRYMEKSGIQLFPVQTLDQALGILQPWLAQLQDQKNEPRRMD